ncbi:glycosyltransferase family 4 protein [Mucilaginibacter sp. Mucisp86]|uniref:glycosyltransferase family 4 protein n=1 Tax=Mucilaginibacter sp. Mucisp86 TaxID=3243060 RepID=UPI0039B37B01
MKNVILITDVNFWEKCSGNRARIEALISYIAKHVKLTVVNTGPAPKHMETYLADRYQAEFIILESDRILNSTAYIRRLRSVIKNRSFDSIIIEYVHSSYFLNCFPENVRMILDAHDIVSERARQFAAFNYQGVLYEMNEEDEYRLFQCYDHVMVLSSNDQTIVSGVLGPERTILSPHPVVTTPKKLRNAVSNITFIASSYLPNVDGISFFIENCWPAIRSKYDVTLNVIGTVCEKFQSAPEKNIMIKGFAANLDDVYADADIIINPVRFGAGLKIKNIEALGNGLPLVTTSHGASGLGKIPADIIKIADQPEEFVNAVVQLIDNYELRKSQGAAAYRFIRQNFSEEVCFSGLLHIIA